MHDEETKMNVNNTAQILLSLASVFFLLFFHLSTASFRYCPSNVNNPVKKKQGIISV